MFLTMANKKEGKKGRKGRTSEMIFNSDQQKDGEPAGVLDEVERSRQKKSQRAAGCVMLYKTEYFVFQD
jgi:hypothetical protein